MLKQIMPTFGRGEFMKLQFEYTIEVTSVSFSCVRVDIDEDVAFEIRMYFGFDRDGYYGCEDLAMKSLTNNATLTQNMKAILSKVAEEVEALHILHMEGEARQEKADYDLEQRYAQ